jgi:peptide chain release factor 1
MSSINIDNFREEYIKIEKEISQIDYSEWEKAQSLLRRKKILQEIIETHKDSKAIEEEIEKNRQILAQEKDQGLLELFASENEKLKMDLDKKNKVIEVSINLLNDNNKIEDEGKSTAVIEIRAGVGGEEANLFVKNLFEAYSKYCEHKDWKIVLLGVNETDTGGYKEVIFEILDKNSYQVFKDEAGVHRVQRVPATEKNNRVHTSTVSVVVLPKLKNIEFEIKPEDIRIDVCRSSGPGGQNVNKRETAVRITHLETGMAVSCQVERTQKDNRERALEILKTKIFLLKQEQEKSKAREIKKSQVETSERSEKKRTYNFPQNRLTDHVLGKSWNNLREIMNGNMDVLFSNKDEQ